jgi:putative ABC transport system permease protein
MPLEQFNLMTGQLPGSFGTVLSNYEIDFDANLLSGIMDARNPEAFDVMNSQTVLITASITIVAVLFTIVVIFLVTSLMINESSSTISLLKILGYHKKELIKMILNSSTAVVMLGIGLGLPLMAAFGNVLFNYVADVTNMLVPMVINPLYVLAGFVLIFAVYEITKRLCGKRLEKIPMSEALKAGSE